MSISRFSYALCLLALPFSLLSCSLFWDGDGHDDLPEDGLIAYYPLDGTAEDVVGGHDGLVFGATSAVDRFGVAGRAMRFDGNDFIRVDDSEAFNFDMREESYSISFWVEVDSTVGRARLVVKWNEFTTTPKAFEISKVESEVWGTTYDLAESNRVKIREALGEGWVHIVVSYDAESDVLSGYRDGELVTSLEVMPASDTRNASPMYIGRGAPPVESRYFEGEMDALRIYDRALSGEEVESLYDEGR